jgi:hypothetical protein
MNKDGNSLINVSRITHGVKPSRGMVFGLLILAALVAFEIFNYSTTDFALTDFLGDLRFAGLRWATILAIAFCGIDFAGIARLFTPEKAGGESKEVWYLFGAWLLAATMNAILTWWGVAIAILGHESLGGSVVSRETMIKVVPVFVAIMVWVIRVLIIGTFSANGSRLFSQGVSRQAVHPMARQSQPQPVAAAPVVSAHAAQYRAMPHPAPKPAQSGQVRTDPTYHPASMSGSGSASSMTRR